MTTATEESLAAEEKSRRGGFSSRRVFILAAIGSAVGLGNIWRFPHVAYDNGGGSFLIPYLVALLVAGIPFLFLDYAVGHKFRGSPPLALARLSRKLEGIGWWQVGVCVVISIYYAAIIGWAATYMVLSANRGWGADPDAFFSSSFLQAGEPGLSLNFVPGLLWPLVAVWVVLIVVMLLGVQKGVGATSVIFIPLLVLVFVVMVVQALMLPGAATGLDAFFTPNWAALLDPGVWVAAFGQIFFSLSVGFGIMITYASYVNRRNDMTGSGLVAGFANSSFELLAGIGVFAVLGFMAQASDAPVSEVVVSSSIGLAFIAFPAIISQAPGGPVIGILFFASLILAGITSMISIVEVVISSVRDKFELKRTPAVLIVTLPMAVVSILLLGTDTALYALDILDHFINNFGILLVAIVSMLVITWIVRAIPVLRDHLNQYGSFRLGRWWTVLLGVVTPIVLGVSLIQGLWTDATEPYEGYPVWLIGLLGWGVAGGVIVIGFLFVLVPWRKDDALTLPTVDPEEVTR
ncbi:sodium-dependent transporter [Microlunatus sp. Y2014]|uniref:sodium-dependent transporter n=1 Tax=Microlunatus sp. Y2014 TaxID=3418488 RepID=UPI003DA6DAB3